VSRMKRWTTRSLAVAVPPSATFFSRLARNVILSRLLVPDQFGTAIAISVVLGLAGLVTDVGLDRFVMINMRPRALSAAHVLLIVRGALLALALVGSAPLTATLFGVPQFAGSFALAALAPLFGGFVHLGIIQSQRDYNYVSESVAQLVANSAAIVAVFAGVMTMHDHRAIIAGFVTESLTYVILSHVLAKVPYRLRSDKQTLRAALSFGLPLTVNGIGLATISQLDRVIVGHWFGVRALGTYAVILNVAVVPVSLILRVFGTLGLSYLLSSRDVSPTNSKNYNLLVFAYSTLALLYSLWVVLTIDILTPFVFGAAFSVDPTVHALITILVFLRLQRGGAPTTALLKSGRTVELALLNFSAVLGLLCALTFVFLRPSFDSIVFGVVVGDFVVFILFFFVSSSARAARHRFATTDFAIPLFALALMTGTFLSMPEITWQARGIVLLAGTVGIAVHLAFGLRGAFVKQAVEKRSVSLMHSDSSQNAYYGSATPDESRTRGHNTSGD
jgi:O-antigen/teichoic acid export membrane protein